MFADGPKKKGKFFKNGASVLKKVKIQDYNFSSFTKRQVAVHDNLFSSIIHSKLHEESELKRSIQSLATFDSDFEVYNKRSIIFPKDFTHEWEEQKKRNKRHDEESEDDIFLEFGEEDNNSGPALKPTPKPTLKPDNLAAVLPQAPEALSISLNPEGFAPPEDKPVNQAHDKKTSNHEDKLKSLQSLTSDRKGILEILDETKHEEPARDIDSIADAKVDEELATRSFDEGKEQGFLEGKIQAEKDFSAQALKLDKVMEELMGLKKSILDNTQENFHEIVKGLCEAIFERESRLNPEVFLDLIRKVVASSVGKTQFTIKLNPEDFERLSALELGNLKDKISANPEIEPFAFKIESHLGSMSGDIKQIVNQFLEESNLRLFDEKNKKS